MILSVAWSAGSHNGNWNTDLSHTSLPKPLGQLPERALDDAVMAANELGNAQPLNELNEFRNRRGEAIREHFLEAASMLIQEIEREEGWDGWLSRLR